MDELKKYRQIIDEIDEQILALYLKRMEISHQIGILKKELNLPVCDKKREAEIIASLSNKIEDSKLRMFYIDLLKLIISQSKKIQEDK